MLRRKLAASRHLSRSLHQEHARNEAILAQLKSMLTETNLSDSDANFAFLSSTVASHSFSGQQPLTTNTNFTLSQLPALKSLMADLRKKTTLLKEGENNLITAKDERREERREYIEQRTKSHLERSGHGAENDSIPMYGKQVDSIELEALEKVAGMFHPP